MRVVLSAFVALVLFVGKTAAQTYTDRASASIQATATVVQSLGVTSPEDNLLYADKGALSAAIDIPINDTDAEALSLHRMLVRYPSLGSVIVSIESGSRAVENYSLSQWRQDVTGEHGPEMSRPGALLLDLADISDNLAPSGSACIMTLIYSEN